MLQSKRATSALIALAAAAAFAGCSSAASPIGALTSATVNGSELGGPPGLRMLRRATSPTRHGWLSPAARTKPLIYVSDYDASAIEIYPQGKSNPSPIGAITESIGGPLGNFVDAHGTLYVANGSNNTVTEYPRGSTSPSVTLSTGISGPISVAVDSKGTVAVGEFANQTILEFPAGSSSPTVTITLLTYPEGLAFDRSRHLYAAWNQNSSGFVGRVSRCQRLQNICVDRGITEGQSGGLAIDESGDLILGDQTNQAINIYAPGATTPTRTISTAGHDPYKFALNKSEKRLYVADINNGQVITYDYATGSQTGTISTGLQSAWGVSLDPPAKYGP
ncbi:MAG: hypothetical protein WB681_09155 [Candidatus Cybelea sp.]